MHRLENLVDILDLAAEVTGLGDGGLVIGFEAVVLQAPLFVLPVEVGDLQNQHRSLANK